MSNNNYKGINTYVINQVHYHARSLIRHPSIHNYEIEDLEQEMMLDYLSRIQAYDLEKASFKTFVDRILNHKCARIIENSNAQKRGSGLSEFSLDSWLENPDGENNELPDPISENSSAHDLLIDLKQATKNMEPKLVVLMIQLSTHSMSEISRLTGIPRSTLYDTLSRLRDELTSYGIQEYLD